MPQKLKVKIKEDKRGKLIEVFKISGAGQVNYVTALPGVVRGDHYHARKKEKYLVVEGQAKINLRNRKNNKTKEYCVSGDDPKIVEVPANWSHNIKNTGKRELKLLVWVNEVFHPNDPDTYAEKV